VSPDGSIYVADRRGAPPNVKRFDSTGKLLNTIKLKMPATAGAGAQFGLAVDLDCNLCSYSHSYGYSRTHTCTHHNIYTYFYAHPNSCADTYRHSTSRRAAGWFRLQRPTDSYWGGCGCGLPGMVCRVVERSQVAASGGPSRTPTPAPTPSPATTLASMTTLTATRAVTPAPIPASGLGCQSRARSQVGWPVVDLLLLVSLYTGLVLGRRREQGDAFGCGHGGVLVDWEAEGKG